MNPTKRLLQALTQLSFMARTSGRPTPELLRACEGAETLVAEVGRALPASDTIVLGALETPESMALSFTEVNRG